jgi:hypothetical protein
MVSGVQPEPGQDIPHSDIHRHSGHPVRECITGPALGFKLNGFNGRMVFPGQAGFEFLRVKCKFIE